LPWRRPLMGCGEVEVTERRFLRLEFPGTGDKRDRQRGTTAGDRDDSDSGGQDHLSPSSRHATGVRVRRFPIQIEDLLHERG
jgi:hypothetical protein